MTLPPSPGTFVYLWDGAYRELPITPTEVERRMKSYLASGETKDPLVAKAWAFQDLTHTWDNRKFRSTAKIYGQLVSNYNGEMVRFIESIKDKENLTPSQMYKLQRYQNITAQLAKELRAVSSERLNSFVRTAEEITAYSVQAAEQLLAHATQSVFNPKSLDSLFSLIPTFSYLPIETIDTMVSRLKPSTLIGQYFDATIPQGVEAMTQQILLGLAEGMNPEKVAKMGFGGLGISLQRMETIYRTEMIEAYRNTNLQIYQDSHVVEGYKRICAHDDRVCPACLALDGVEYPLDAPFAKHPRCRCDAIPIVIGAPVGEPDWENGDLWLSGQPLATQDKILGPRAAELWREGTLKLHNLPRQWEHPVWGNQLRTASLTSLGFGPSYWQQRNFIGQVAAGDKWLDLSKFRGKAIDKDAVMALNPFTNGTAGKFWRAANSAFVKVRVNFPQYAQGRAEGFKHWIVDTLSKTANKAYGYVNEVIRQWAYSSNDYDMRSLAIQQRASQLFGTPLTKWQRFNIQRLGQEAIDEGYALEKFLGGENTPYEAWQYYPLGWREYVEKGHSGADALRLANGDLDDVLKAMYTNSQTKMAEWGYRPGDTITLFRGVGGDIRHEINRLGLKEGDTLRITMNPLESWTDDPGIAERFGSTVLAMEVPIERVVGSASSGFGCLSENEFVLLGGTDEATLWSN